MTTRSTDILLGVLFFATMITLGLVTVMLSDLPLGKERHDVEILSADVGYLRVGDPVLLQGMPAGKVDAIERLPAPRDVVDADGTRTRATVLVRARLDTDPYVLLRADHRVVIEERGLLGGRLIRLEPGTASEPADRAAVLVAVAQPSLTQAAISFIEGDGQEGLGGALGAFTDTMRDLGQGEGALAMLIHDEAFAADLRTSVSELGAFVGDMRAADGTLSRLIHDSALHDEARTLVADWSRTSKDASALLARIDAGEGTLGQLVHDDGLYADARHFFSTSSALIDDVRAGEGTLGQLVVDDSLYVDARRFLDDASHVAAQMTQGEGLLPALLNDPTMRSDLERILEQALAGIEDARETAPVQNLGSFLFGTF